MEENTGESSDGGPKRESLAKYVFHFFVNLHNNSVQNSPSG